MTMNNGMSTYDLVVNVVDYGWPTWQPFSYVDMDKEQQKLYRHIAAQAIRHALEVGWVTLSDHVPARFISGLVLVNGAVNRNKP